MPAAKDRGPALTKILSAVTGLRVTDQAIPRPLWDVQTVWDIVR
jgi:hypothetical protein